jgi:putative transposase
MRIRFTKSQILGFLREAEAGTPVMDLCWNHCFSRTTFRAWKAKYGDLLHPQAPRPVRVAGSAHAAIERGTRAVGARLTVPS